MCPHFSVISGSALRKQEVTTDLYGKKDGIFKVKIGKGKKRNFFRVCILPHITYQSVAGWLGYVISGTRD